MTDDQIDAAAARVKALERVERAARTFMDHIGGFRILDADGRAADVFTANHRNAAGDLVSTFPEAAALREALATVYGDPDLRAPVSCPDCGGTGLALVESDGARRLTEVACMVCGGLGLVERIA